MLITNATLPNGDPVTTAQQAIFHHLTYRPDAAAMTFADSGDLWTFGRLDDAARRWASRLDALGVKPGDRVVSLLKTSPALVVTMLGDLMAGIIHVPVNPPTARSSWPTSCATAPPRW